MLLWLGIVLILAFAYFLNWLPPLTYVGLLEDPLTNLQILIWPALVMGYRSSAIVSRMTRSNLLEVLREDYVRTARAKGLREAVVIARHALRNALLPIVTIIGMHLAVSLGATVLLETIFVVPGLGRLLVTSILFRDYPLVQSIVLMFAAILVLVNLAVDVTYAWLDPRIRYT